MHQTTKNRFARKLGIPATDLNEKVAKQLVNFDDNFTSLYKQLCFLDELRILGKQSGKTPQDFKNWLSEAAKTTQD